MNYAAIPSEIQTKDTTYVMDVRRDNEGWNTLEDLLGLTRYLNVSINEAIRDACFLICADVIAQDLSKATLRMKKRISPKKNEILEPQEHMLATFIADKPNDEFTWDEVWEQTFRGLAVWSNSYFATTTNNRGDVREVVPFSQPQTVIYVEPTTGKKYYQVTRRSNFETALLREFDWRIPDTQVVHFRTRLYGGPYGVSTLDAGADVLAKAKSIGDYQNRLYSDDARNKGVFEIPQELSADAYERLRRQLAAAWKAQIERNKPLILEGGVKFEGTSMSAKDSDVAQVADAQLLEVCRLFRMPPHKVMVLNAVKYENMDTMERIYASDTLIPIAKRVEGRLSASWLMQKEVGKIFFEFDREEMVANDPKTRAEQGVKAAQSGLMLVDEARRYGFNMDPLPNDIGNTRFIPVNMTVVDENNKVVIQGAAKDKNGPDNGTNGAGDLQDNGTAGKEASNIISIAARK